MKTREEIDYLVDNELAEMTISAIKEWASFHHDMKFLRGKKQNILEQVRSHFYRIRDYELILKG
jgi:hypothetical protein